MKKLLIAETTQTLVQAVTKQLKTDLAIFQCDNGEAVLEEICNVRPDIILLDLHLSRVDGLDVLRTIRSCGITAKVIVTTCLQNDVVCRELENLQVHYIFIKPCSVSAVVSRIRDLATMDVKPMWTVEYEANHILLELGFRMGLARYDCIYRGLILKYQGVDGGITKCLYPMVARSIGGNSSQVEKAIRDAIKDAFSHGNQSVWQMYFPRGTDGQIRCPSNEVFLARIAYALQQRFALSLRDTECGDAISHRRIKLG